MHLITVPLNHEDQRGCLQLCGWTKGETSSEVLILAVEFLLQEILPVYDEGGRVALCAPDGHEVHLEWGLPLRKSTFAATFKIPKASECAESVSVKLPKGAVKRWVHYVLGRRTENLPVLIRFALSVFHTALFHAMQGWKLIRIVKKGKSAVSIARYLKRPGPRPVDILLGGLEQ